jgi:hypothetical protein
VVISTSVQSLALMAEPGGLWAGWSDMGRCRAARRTAGGWVVTGSTNSIWATFQCEYGAMAVGDGVGPFVLFHNALAGSPDDDIRVYALNR